MASISSKILNENETARRTGAVVQPSDGRGVMRATCPTLPNGRPSSPVPVGEPCRRACGLRCREGRRPGGRRGYRLNATSNRIGSAHPAPGRRRARLPPTDQGAGQLSGGPPLLARKISRGSNGHLYQRYQDGTEDQISVLGLVPNALLLFNTRYVDAAVTQLRATGFDIRDEDVAPSLAVRAASHQHAWAALVPASRSARWAAHPG